LFYEIFLYVLDIKKFFKIFSKILKNVFFLITFVTDNIYLFIMKSKTLFTLVLCVFLASCNNEIDDFNLHDESEKCMIEDARLTEALNRAERLMSRIEGGTRSSVRLIESVEYIGGNQLTRGGSVDSLYFLVNFSDNKGFAVLGATEDNGGVYAISPEGHLEMEDTVDNPGLAMFFAGLPSVPGGRPIISIDSTLIDKPIHFYTRDLSTEMKPVLSKSVAAWHQWTPFNNECNPNGTNYPAGCAPLAVAMIMSYYQWPTSYNGVVYDWNKINSAWTSSEIISAKIPKLLQQIGSKENMNTNYKNDGSGTDTKLVYKRTFNNFGYKTPGDLRNYSYSELSRCMENNKKPVLMRGDKKGGGHVWVVDGFYNDWHWSNGLTIDEYYGEGYVFHIVWGWNRSCNGYFKLGDKIVSAGKYNSYDDDSYLTDEEKEAIQYTELQFVGDIEPNK